MALKRILITGAGGGLGKVLRQSLVGTADIIRLSARRDIGEAAAHEEIQLCDLADAPAVDRLLRGRRCRRPHGRPVDRGRLGHDRQVANIVGMINLYEAARKAGTKRIIFASSNHAIGMHPITRKLDSDSPPPARIRATA